MFKNLRKINLQAFIFIFLSGFFSLSWLYIRFFLLNPLIQVAAANEQKLTSLHSEQKNESELLNQIHNYRDGLYALDLVLNSRKEVIKGSDPDNPYLVFDLHLLLQQLKKLLPQDARATKFQLTNKGLVTIPIESVDYASLGRVLKSFKNESVTSQNQADASASPKMFKDVMVPSGAQRTLAKATEGNERQIKSSYSFVLQAQLNPHYWQYSMLYPDVDPTAFYYQAVLALSQAGMVEGYPEGHFKPLNPISWAEFFKVILAELLSNKTISDAEYQNYLYVSPEEWPERYLRLSDQIGIENEGDQEFRPHDQITRMEALKILFNIFRVEARNPDQKEDEQRIEVVPFTDVASDDEHFHLLAAAHRKGLFDYLEGTFEPEQAITRWEVAYWVWKLKFQS